VVLPPALQDIANVKSPLTRIELAGVSSLGKPHSGLR
jgi:hypothetical protein